MIFIEVDDHVVSVMVNQSFAHFGLDDKRKLLPDIVRGTGAGQNTNGVKQHNQFDGLTKVMFCSPI